MGRTHMLLGAASLWLLRPLPNVLSAPDVVPMLAFATFGALLPDLDAAGSTLKYWRIGGVQPFVPIAQLLHRRFGHRGALHSLRGLGVLALLLLPLLIWWPWRWYLALLARLCQSFAGGLLYQNRHSPASSATGTLLAVAAPLATDHRFTRRRVADSAAGIGGFIPATDHITIENRAGCSGITACGS